MRPWVLPGGGSVYAADHPTEKETFNARPGIRNPCVLILWLA
jgi:hypothetical protein